ncbi:MAG: prepilin-type N-terminal cleavage/methylation domain-containing protein [Verrucomicrobiales bacterium]
MKLPSQAPSHAAFTLVELIISAALMSMILGAAYMCMSAGVAGQKLVEGRTEAAQTARAAMALITADLRAACVLSTNIEFAGMPRTIGSFRADNLDFGTHNYRPKRARESDFCEVSYFTGEDRETGLLKLMRRRDATPDDQPLAGGVIEEIASSLMGVRFEYYDGYDWYEEWGDPTGKAQFSLKEESNMSGLPEAVRITMLVSPSRIKPSQEPDAENPEPPMIFQSVARINLAPITLLNSGSSSSSGTASGTAPSAAGSMPGGPQ